jgi:hypothetical protein
MGQREVHGQEDAPPGWNPFAGMSRIPQTTIDSARFWNAGRDLSAISYYTHGIRANGASINCLLSREKKVFWGFVEIGMDHAGLIQASYPWISGEASGIRRFAEIKPDVT